MMGNGVWHSQNYNSRLQECEFQDVLKASSWSRPSCTGTPVSGGVSLLAASLNWGGSSKNGNLQSASQADSGPDLAGALTFNQSYSYDAVNRLTSVVDTGYTRNFQYDAFGNLWISGAGGITPAGNAPQAANLYANNQFLGGSYDAFRNQTVVNANTISYDAENRQIGVNGTGVAESYLYDGDGKRVEKTGSGNITIYVYDAMAELAAEYSTVANHSLCTTCYLSIDQLGTPRLITDAQGKVVGRHDYLPFGEEIGWNGQMAGRTSQWGPGNDSVNQKFTGKERDAESGLDYFGARYYGGALGRFSGPDARGFTRRTIVNPQKWNKYAYVLNNPFKYVDPDGLEELKIVIKTSIPYKTTWMFGTYNGGEKTSTEIRVETSRSINNGSPMLSAAKETVHPAQLLRGSLDLGGDTHGTTSKEATATKNFKITDTGQTADTQFFGFHQEAANPLSPVPDWLTPVIIVDLDFEFDDAATWISVSGQTTQFPSFDISVTRANGTTVPVYHRDPYFNTTLWLFLPNYVNSEQVLLNQPKGCVAIGSEKPTCEK